MNKEMKLKSNSHRLFPNHLKQNFAVSEPNRVWCTDFTYLYLTNGTVRYNCMIIDLCDRSMWLRVKMGRIIRLI